MITPVVVPLFDPNDDQPFFARVARALEKAKIPGVVREFRRETLTNDPLWFDAIAMTYVEVIAA